MSLHALEMALLSTIWHDSDFDPSTLSPDLFQDTLGKFDEVMKYRSEGHPLGDIFVSHNILGVDLTAELFKAYQDVVKPSLPHYVRQLKIARYNQRLEQALGMGEVTPELLEQGLRAYKKAGKIGNLYSLSGDLSEYINDLDERISGSKIMYDLGFKRLDEYLGGLELGNFFIVKAKPKVGKTNFLVRVFLNMESKGIPCLYLTSESDYIQLLDKFVSIESDISARNIRRGRLTPAEQKIVIDTISTKIAGRKASIFHTGMFDTAKIQELITETGAKVVFVDYLQKFSYQSDDTKTQSYEKIAQEIKAIGVDRQVLMIAGSQVNEQGGTKWCAGYDEGADAVIHLKTSDDSAEKIKVIEASVDLTRYGTNGVVKLALNRKTCNMFEIDPMEMTDEVARRMDWVNK